MATISAFAVRDAFRKLSSEPLSLGETMWVASALFLGGTIYCQLYCLIAFQQMHGMAMPLTLSMQRSAVETLPALAAFELSKRALGDSSRIRRFARMAITFALAAGLTIAALVVFQALGYGSAMPVRLMVAGCLPALALAVVAIAWADHLRQADSRRQRDGEREPTTTGMPPNERIDWVQAAGNYIELHFAGRTRLVRMTLRDALSLLGSERFVQVHRSVLVNRDRIRALRQGHRRSEVQLADGTSLKVGGIYRAKLFDE